MVLAPPGMQDAPPALVLLGLSGLGKSAAWAGAQVAPWDGYLKYYTLGVKVSALSVTQP